MTCSPIMHLTGLLTELFCKPGSYPDLYSLAWQHFLVPWGQELRFTDLRQLCKCSASAICIPDLPSNLPYATANTLALFCICRKHLHFPFLSVPGRNYKDSQTQESILGPLMIPFFKYFILLLFVMPGIKPRSRTS